MLSPLAFLMGLIQALMLEQQGIYLLSFLPSPVLCVLNKVSLGHEPKPILHPEAP